MKIYNIHFVYHTIDTLNISYWVEEWSDSVAYCGRGSIFTCQAAPETQWGMSWFSHVMQFRKLDERCLDFYMSCSSKNSMSNVLIFTCHAAAENRWVISWFLHVMQLRNLNVSCLDFYMPCSSGNSMSDVLIFTYHVSVGGKDATVVLYAPEIFMRQYTSIWIRLIVFLPPLSHTSH